MSLGLIESFELPRSMELPSRINMASATSIYPPLATPPQSPTDLLPSAFPSTDPSAAAHMPTLTELLRNSQTVYIPPGYVMCIPCYLCKQPFDNVDKLKEHLTLHAMQIQAAAPAPAAPKPTVKPKTVHICELCGKSLSCSQSLRCHVIRVHRVSATETKDQPLPCPMCKKIYKRKTPLLVHMKIKHGITQQPTPPIPPTETPSAPKRTIWTTSVLNSVAAAHYNPAQESSASYQHPAKKYLPRSPYFNPNLWLQGYY